MYMGVNALSGLYLISTQRLTRGVSKWLTVSMPSRAYTSFLQAGVAWLQTKLRQRVNALSGLYLISTIFIICNSFNVTIGVNALSGLYLISTYPFKNLGFMRFPEPVFAGIYQNILTNTVFRAC